MQDWDKTKEQLIAELDELRRQVAALNQASQEPPPAAAPLQAVPHGNHEGDPRGQRGNDGFGVDITAEEVLRQSGERFRVAFEEAPVGMIITDANGVVVKVNRALCRMSGFNSEEIVGHHGREFNYPDDLETTAPLAGKLLSGQVPSFMMQKRYLKKDGGFFWSEMMAAAIRGPEGTVAFGLAIVQDITERKQAHEALERERQSLWKMLQASDHERQTISYEIHDGLTQYLAAAGMQFQAHKALRNDSPNEAKKAYDTAVELVRQAHLEARRLISEVRPPVIDEIGLETAISHLVHEQRRRGGPKIELHSKVHFGRLTSILENALYRIAQEALNNACKHSKSKKVAISLTQEDQDVQLKIQDWGIGFDPESVGTGHFGLEGIRQRVRLLGGRLTIESTPDSGALVQVVVPILEKQGKE
jgi:PAS domain S-box-containing protein